MVELYLHSIICLHSVVLNLLSTVYSTLQLWGVGSKYVYGSIHIVAYAFCDGLYLRDLMPLYRVAHDTSVFW
jgi:hypothetical protein